MEKWEPILWIIVTGVGWFALLLALEYLKGQGKRKSSDSKSSAAA